VESQQLPNLADGPDNSGVVTKGLAACFGCLDGGPKPTSGHVL
jgi:hypothetical protein